MVADVAVVFHWTPQAFDGLTIEELMGWHARAIERANTLGLFRGSE